MENNDQLLVKYFLDILEFYNSDSEYSEELLFFEKNISNYQSIVNYNNWNKIVQSYNTVSHKYSYLKNSKSEIAKSYSKMNDFWNDFELQKEGKSDNTIWDVFENGKRRRFEKVFANSYKSEDAILLNSGMSCACTLLDYLLLPSDCLLISENCYFEVQQYTNYLVKRGVSVIKANLHETNILQNILKTNNVKVIFFETAGNTPYVEQVYNVLDIIKLYPQITFIIDNSVQSHLTNYFSLLPDSNNFIVFESLCKYVCNNIMGGVLYCNKQFSTEFRLFTTNIGQQLQEKALNYVNLNAVISIKYKLKIHSDNVSLFCKILNSSIEFFDFLRVINSNTPLDTSNNLLFENGLGSLVYIAIKINENADINYLHRSILDKWINKLQNENYNIFIKAGYGYEYTTCRVYQSNTLNISNAPSYIRISIGMEPAETIKYFATCFVECVKKTFNNIV